ncbi:MAG: hypothetical protein JW768_01410 [Chitinispirillaceae bacterium]|nr:hypothetical protein [Chitinispirillaceae bacterium]
MEKIDYTPELLSGLRSKLAMAGKCSADTPIETKERLREIFLSKPTPLHQRGVAASITTQKSFDQDEVSRKLAIEAKRREKERSKDARALETATELRPMLRCLHELLLTGSDLLTVRKSFEQRGFAQKSIEKYNTELRSLLSDSLVRSGLKVLPSLYDRCGDCKEFLARRQSLRPKLAARFEKCQGCNHNSDGVGCRLMSCSFINPGEVPPLEVRKIALYNLKEKQLISSTESSKSELIEQFRPLEGLKKAFQLVDSRRSIAPVRTAAVSGQRPEMQFKRLKTTGLDAVGDDAARYSRAEIDADELHHCMVKRYPVNPSATKIIRSGKCMGCDFGKDGMRCAAQGVPFADEMKVSDDISEANKEGREIRSYFAGTEIKVEIDKKPLKKMLEIEVENAGKNLVVDSGRRSADPAPDILLSMQGAEMPVEIDPPRTYAPPLVIGGLNAGFNIDV